MSSDCTAEDADDDDEVRLIAEVDWLPITSAGEAAVLSDDNGDVTAARLDHSGADGHAPNQGEPSYVLPATRAQGYKMPRPSLSRQQPYGPELVGRRVRILWAGDTPQTWFSGVVSDFCSPEHLIVYSDGETKWHNLLLEEAYGQLQLVSEPEPGPELADDSDEVEIEEEAEEIEEVEIEEEEEEDGGTHEEEDQGAQQERQPMDMDVVTTAEDEAARPPVAGDGGGSGHIVDGCAPASGAAAAAPDAPRGRARIYHFTVQCDRCQKWRKLPPGAARPSQAQDWFCWMLPGAPQDGMRACEAAEEAGMDDGSAAGAEGAESEEEGEEEDGEEEEGDEEEEDGDEGSRLLDGDDVYEAKSLVKDRVRVRGKQRVRQFLVEWEGYALSEATWEDESNIFDKALIREFEERKRELKRQERKQAQVASVQGGASTLGASRAGAGGGGGSSGAPSGSSRAPPGPRPPRPSELKRKRSAEIRTAQSMPPPALPLAKRPKAGARDSARDYATAMTRAEASAGVTVGGVSSSTAASRPSIFNIRTLASRSRHHQMRIPLGPDHQAVMPPSFEPPAPARWPRCLCDAPARWHARRWWCAHAPLDERAGSVEHGDEHGDEPGHAGCGFEAAQPPAGLPVPRCGCGRPSVWLRQHWWCAAPEGSPACCGFRLKHDEPPAPELLSEASLQHELHEGHAALARAQELAAEHGTWVDRFCFVAFVDDAVGLGLFARSPCAKAQILCEYGGPRLPTRLLKAGAYALVVPGSQHFIDGHSENCPMAALTMPRYPGTFANHSTRPNAKFLRLESDSRGPFDVRYRLYMVAIEPIPAGAEIRVDYENGSRSGYWNELGSVPSEGEWRSKRLVPPPPSGALPRIEGVGRLPPPAVPTCVLPSSAADLIDDEDLDARVRPSGGGIYPIVDTAPVPEPPAPRPFSAEEDRRLFGLVPQLLQATKSNWVLIASHLPGRTGLDCRERWNQLHHDEVVDTVRRRDRCCLCYTSAKDECVPLTWIRCDACRCWAHVGCAGIAERHAASRPSWRCPTCRDSGGLQPASGGGRSNSGCSSSTTTADTSTALPPAAAVPAAQEPAEGYPCARCGRRFLTAQSAGGHARYCTGSTGSTSGATISGGGGGTRGGGSARGNGGGGSSGGSGGAGSPSHPTSRDADRSAISTIPSEGSSVSHAISTISPERSAISTIPSEGSTVSSTVRRWLQALITEVEKQDRRLRLEAKAKEREAKAKKREAERRSKKDLLVEKQVKSWLHAIIASLEHWQHMREWRAHAAGSITRLAPPAPVPTPTSLRWVQAMPASSAPSVPLHVANVVGSHLRVLPPCNVPAGDKPPPGQLPPGRLPPSQCRTNDEVAVRNSLAAGVDSALSAHEAGQQARQQPATAQQQAAAAKIYSELERQQRQAAVPGQLPPSQLPPSQWPPSQLPPSQLPPSQLPPSQLPQLNKRLTCICVACKLPLMAPMPDEPTSAHAGASNTSACRIICPSPQCRKEMLLFWRKDGRKAAAPWAAADPTPVAVSEQRPHATSSTSAAPSATAALRPVEGQSARAAFATRDADDDRYVTRVDLPEGLSWRHP